MAVEPIDGHGRRCERCSEQRVQSFRFNWNTCSSVIPEFLLCIRESERAEHSLLATIDLDKRRPLSEITASLFKLFKGLYLLWMVHDETNDPVVLVDFVP